MGGGLMKIHRYLMIFTRDFLALWDPEDTTLIESVALVCLKEFIIKSGESNDKPVDKSCCGMGYPLRPPD
jgi:hypothetical protein